MPMILAAVFTVIVSLSQSCAVRLPNHTVMQPASTLNGRSAKVHKSFGSHTESLEAVQEVQPLRCLLEDALGVEGPCECVCNVCGQKCKTANNYDR